MQFRESQPIYFQIAIYMCEKMIMKEWKAGERVPSVRELAIALKVNPNTVMRTYEFLQQLQIISTERGIGYFATDKAYRNALTWLKDEFMEKDIPHFFKLLILLEMDLNELAPAFEKYKKKNFPNSEKRYENK